MGYLSVHDIRDLIIDRLSGGSYAVGSRLPAARELASEIGSHRNTVAKAYRTLAELGLVTVKQGSGTYVASLVNSGNRPNVSEQVRDGFAQVVAKARLMGIPEVELRRILDGQIEAVYGDGASRAAFIECNLEDLESAVAEIELLTSYRLAPLLLDDLRANGARAVAGYETVVTSLFHIKEVSDRLATTRPETRVIGVYTHPDERALDEIARIRPGSRVGIVVGNAEGAQRFVNQIGMVTTVTTKALVCPSDAEIRALAREVDAIVCSRSWAARVMALILPIPVVTLPFHVSPQSAGRMIDVLVRNRELTTAAVGAGHETAPARIE